jgi:hypothetical protein
MNKKLLCALWIVSVLLVGGLLWFFTRSFRMRLLTEDVNKVLAKSGGGQVRTVSFFPGGSSAVLNGTWFAVQNTSGDAAGNAAGNAAFRNAAGVNNAFVFTLIRNGISAACVALVDDSGRVRTIIPLSGSARQITEELPRPVYRFYVDRIEQAARNRIAKLGGSW